MAEHALALWVYQAGEDIFTIAITNDGRFTFAGGYGVLYCFERSGNLIWRGTLEGIALSITLAEGSGHVLVGCSSGKAYIWSYQGHLLQMIETIGAISGLSSTPTSYRIALGTADGMLSLHDATGHLLWQHKLPRSIRQLGISSDGNTLALGCDDHQVYSFDGQGNQLWHMPTLARVWAGAALSASGNCILAGSNDQHVYCFDRSGHLHWRNDTGSEVNRIALTSDGQFAAAGGNGQTLWLWRQSGERVWKVTTPGEVYGLAISQDGRFVAAGTLRRAVVLFDERGQLLWTQQMRDRVRAIAMTASGRLVAAVADDHTISLVENQLASEEVKVWEVEPVIRVLRRQMSQNEDEGIALWFNNFDQALQERRLEVCERLVQELREGGYKLEGEEQRWMESREGTLWLYQGLRYQQQQQESLAKQAYERSRERQRELHYLQGEGQALLALKTLESSQGERDQNLLALLTNPPEILGNSEKILEQRIKNVPKAAQQYQLVLTAQRLGYLRPLLAAQSSSHASVRAASAAALHWLNPGPSVNTLLDLLTSPYWIERWQATLMLTQRARRSPKALAAYREPIRQRVNEFLQQEHDPTVLRSMIILLRSIGDAAQVPTLLPLLQDPDLEVRLETITTLGQIGTREALPGLQRIASGRNAMEQRLNDYAALARQRIRQRTPLARIQQVVCSAELTEQRPIESTSLFLTYNPEIHCVAMLVNITPGLRVKCTIRGANQEPMEQEEQLSIRSLQHEKQTDAQRSLRDWLYRLLAEEDETFWTWREDEEDIDSTRQTDGAKEIVFSFVPLRRTWFPGIYTAEIALNDVVKYKQVFKVVSREAMLVAPYYYSKGLFFQHHKRYLEAFIDYEQTLKFDSYHIDALCNVGDIWTVRGRLKEASEAYARAFQLDANRALIHFCTEGPLHLLELNSLRGIFAALFQTMLAIVDSTVVSDTTTVLTQLGEAITAWLLYGKESAIDILTQVVQSVPGSLGDHSARIIGLALLDRREEGLAALKQRKAQGGNAIVATMLQAGGLALLEQKEESLAALDRVLYETPQSIVLNITKAIIQIKFQQNEEALATLEQALNIDPNVILLAALKGLVLHRLGRDEQMLATIQQAIDFNTELPQAQLLKAGAFILAQRHEEALILVEKMLALAPNSIPGYALAVYLLMQLKLDERALAQCEQIIQRLPYFAFGHFVQGQLATQLGRDTAASKAFEQAEWLGLDTAALRRQKVLAHRRQEDANW